ncbi:MAG: TIGR03089 family protein [Tetrasphaera sp.]
MRPDDLLPRLLRSDPARPRITCYDDTTGERIELSAKVLANWVAKAANLLQEEFDAGPGTRVALDLAPHWRTLYWALATWAVGAEVTTDPGADVLVTADPTHAAGHGAAIIVTLPALARRSAHPLPDTAFDEAKELAGYPDQANPWDRADDDAPALSAGGEAAAYENVVPDDEQPGARVHTTTSDTAGFLRLALSTYAADGSIVLSITPGDAPEPGALAARLAAEGVTRQA